MRNSRLDRNADALEARDLAHVRRHICYGKDSPAPPPAPDYVGAAQATSAGNLQAAQAATAANRVNQYSPYGSSTYSQANPNDPTSQWSQQINLSPTGQSLLDSLNRSQLGTAGLEQGATQNVASSMGQPFNYSGPGVQTSLNTSGVPAIPGTGDQVAKDAQNTAYAAATSRLDPQWAQNSEMNDSTLANQGITQGSQAYDNAMRTFNQGENDAYTQAQAAAVQQGLAEQQAQFGMGAQANQQAFNQAQAGGQFANQASGQNLSQQLALYNQPLNSLNAIRSASQVTTPQFGAVPQQGQTAGPNYSGAAQAQGQYGQGLYNAQIGAQNAQTSGLFGLGGAALNYAAFA